MRAVTISDGGLVIAEHPDPVLGAGEVLVRVRAAGLNGADMMQVRGKYPPPPGWPVDIPGMELAGEVAAVGPGVTRFHRGERVMGLVGGGAQAELAVVHERILMPVPDNLTWEQAGGVPEVFTTAHDALLTQGNLRSGERLLVHGAAGGVGSAAVQLGVSLGARVTATVRNAELRGAVAELGSGCGAGAAVNVVDPAGFGAHGPFDVILELVGAQNLTDNLESLATGGRVVVIGIGAGARTELDLRTLMGRRGSIHASTLRGRPLEEKALTARAVEREVLPLLASGRISVPVAAAYPLDEAARAYDRFRAGGKLGKIVLTA